MTYGRRIYVMDEQRERAQGWSDLAERWSDPAHRAEARLASMPHGPEDEGIEVVDVIESLVENRGNRFIVNVENGGSIPNLPVDAIVEVPAVVDGYGVHTLAVGSLDRGARLAAEPPLGGAAVDGPGGAQRRPAHGRSRRSRWTRSSRRR